MTDVNTLKAILLAVIEILDNGDYDTVSFYGALPEEYIDIFEGAQEECRRSDSARHRSYDEFLAVNAIRHTDLHPLMREIVESAAALNFPTPICDDEDYVGGAIARELALCNKQDVIPFARFIATNDLDHGVYQTEDMEQVVEKWGPCRETYSLVVARWLTPGQHQYEFAYGSTCEAMQSEDDARIFMAAVAQWFSEKWGLHGIGKRYDDVLELLGMIFEKLAYSREDLAGLIDDYIQETDGIDTSGRSIAIQNKKTLELLNIAYDMDKTSLHVSYGFGNAIAMAYSSVEELQEAVAALKVRCAKLGYALEEAAFAAHVEDTIEGSGAEIGAPVDILSLFTPEGEATPAEKMSEDILKDKKKIPCRKLQLYQSMSSVATLLCDIQGKRMLDTLAQAHGDAYFWNYETEGELLAALEDRKNTYLAQEYELVLDETVEYTFDYTLEICKQSAQFMADQKAMLAAAES